VLGMESSRGGAMVVVLWIEGCNCDWGGNSMYMYNCWGLALRRIWSRRVVVFALESDRVTRLSGVSLLLQTGNIITHYIQSLQKKFQ